MNTPNQNSSLSALWGFWPLLAVYVGIWLVGNALLAVALYHGGLLLGMWRRNFQPRSLLQGWSGREGLGMSLLCMGTWPLVILLWPWMQLGGLDLSAELEAWGFSNFWLTAGFIVYSLTLHPMLEEGFWRGVMPKTWLTDLQFAAFHVLVLIKWVHWPWALLAGGVLTAASWIWRWYAERKQGLSIPVLSHAIADLALILALPWMMPA